MKSSNLQLPPIETITRSHLTTSEAGFYLNLRDQTMRKHACKEDFPIRPIRINGRLYWSKADICALLAGGEK